MAHYPLLMALEERMSLASTMKTTTAQQYIGTRQERLEDGALLRGQGKYGDDVPVPPGTLHAAIVRSPHPHARLKSVDPSRALAMRSEERRVGKECRSRWGREHEKKKK